MKSVTRRSIVLAAPALSVQLASAQAPLDDDALTARVKAVESTLGARLGVSAQHIESGTRFRYQSGEVYPMWSTYKLPIAIEVLNRVDAGQEQLDRLVEVQPRHFSSGSGTLTDLFRNGRVALSVRNLLELMLVVSDNTATSLFLDTVGAPAVNARLRGLGITGIRVELPNMERIARLTRFELPPREKWTPELAIQVNESVRPLRPGNEAWEYAMKVLREDPRDQGSPDAFVDLLRAIHTHKALSSRSESLLLDIMRRCRTGPNSIKGLLPKELEVAHKSGNGMGSTNDVGLVPLPNGTLAIAVLMRDSVKTSTEQSLAIAQVTKLIYDNFSLKRAG